ncbi:hypothetical protein [Pseudoneobacillus sp. C159]
MPKGRSGGSRSTGRRTTGRRTSSRRTSGRQGGVRPGQLFVNTVSIGTNVTVRLISGQTIRGRFFGIVNGLITVGTNFINPNDIVAFSV